MVKAPGLVNLLVRLLFRVLLWMTLALVIGALLFVFRLVVKAILFGAAHHGAKMPTPHGWGFAYLSTSMLCA